MLSYDSDNQAANYIKLMTLIFFGALRMFFYFIFFAFFLEILFFM